MPSKYLESVLKYEPITHVATKIELEILIENISLLCQNYGLI